MYYSDSNHYIYGVMTRRDMLLLSILQYNNYGNVFYQPIL